MATSNPNIALSVRQPQFRDPLDLQREQAAAQGQMQQNALTSQVAPMQVQQAHIQTQQMQQQFQDEQNLRRAYMDAGGDLDKTQENAMKYGVSPTSLMKLRANVLDMKMKYATLHKDRLANETQQNEMYRGVVKGIMQADDGTPEGQARAAQLWQAEVAKVGALVQAGKLSPDMVAHIPQQYPGLDGLKMLDAHLATGKQLAEEADRAMQAKGRAQQGQAAMENADRQASQQKRQSFYSSLGANPPEDAGAYRSRIVNSGLSPNDVKELLATVPIESYDPKTARDKFLRLGTPPAQQLTADNKNESNPTEAALAVKATDPNASPEERAAANAALKRLNQSKMAARPVVNNFLPGMPEGGTPQGQSSGEEFLATLPVAVQSQVKGIAEGRLTMPSASTRSQAAQQLRSLVMQYDPDFNEQRAQARKAFAPGTKEGVNTQNLNTATVHLDALGELGRAMDNGTFQPKNALFNQVSTMLGGAAPTNYQGLREAVAGEMDRALHGTSTIEGRTAIAATMPDKAAPGQIAGIIETQLHTLGAKLAQKQEQYEQYVPGDKVWSPISKSARAVFQKHGFDPTAGPAVNVHSGAHVIALQGKQYRYNGSGDTADIKNYTEVK